MEQYKVCVTDDMEETASVLCEGLGLHGYEAVAAHTGQKALEICAQGDIDLILLDICLPDIDGYEVCRRLKESPKSRNTAVIFVTVKNSQEDIARGYELGAVDYITKPYNLPMVMLRVDTVLNERALEGTLHEEGDHVGDCAYTDQLTGLRNRRFLLERLEEEAEEAHTHDYPLSCVVFDVDDVTALDLELGPVSMDDLLVELAMSLRNHSRTYDILARYDATMFAAVLPHSPIEHAEEYARNVLGEVEATTFSDPSFPTSVSLSAGIVTCRNGSAQGADHVLGEAMRRLLEAKSMGAERVAAHPLPA